jgi:hypothetical protein
VRQRKDDLTEEISKLEERYASRVLKLSTVAWTDPSGSGTNCTRRERPCQVHCSRVLIKNRCHECQMVDFVLIATF